MTLKVCHLTPSFRLPHGPSAGLLAQIEYQDRSKIESQIVSMYAAPDHLDATALLVARGIRHASLRVGRSFADLRALPRLVRLLRRERPDILQCHLVRANLYGPVAAAIAGVPVVVSTVRNIEDYMVSNAISSRAIRWIESLVAKRVNAYVAVSERVAQVVVSALDIDRAKVVTILNSVELSPFRASSRRPERDAVVIGAAGGLERRKDFELLIRAMRGLPGVQAVIAGEGEEQPKLEALIRSEGLAGRVTLAGLIQDMPSFLQSIDIFVIVSLAEGLPRALMEAMASALPVIVTDAGGNAEAVEHGVSGFVIPIGDEAKLTEFARVLTSDRELRERMGASARERAFKLFDPSRMAAQYTNLYEGLVR